MQFHTLLLTPWMEPHRVVTWQDSVCRVVDDEIETLETTWDGELFAVSSPSVTIHVPSVARIKAHVPAVKKGVKFSRINVLTRDNFQCQYCGNRFPRRQLNYDHVLPRLQGGRTVWENIVTACYPCNGRKAGRTPAQAGMRLLKQPHRPKTLPLGMPAIPIVKAPREWMFYLQAVPHLELAFG